MRRFIGWVVNFYPEHFFYSSDFGQHWDMSVPEGESDDPHVTVTTTALLAVAVAAGRNITEVGGTLSAEYTTVTSGGKDIGSFRVTIEKLNTI